MSTLFISDLHLEDGRPGATVALRQLLAGRARDAEAVYVLGDLFEFWIGDDVLSETARAVAEDFSALRSSGVPCYFLHGNRDFLLGPAYAAMAGLELLPEHHVVQLYGAATLLLHGDTLCTDDLAYQAFRRQVRDPGFQARFLQHTPQQRLEIARSARDASRQHTGSAASAIMDVNEDTVLATFRQSGVEHMIHGHTHRPARHEHALGAGRKAERIVLADWYASASCLEVSEQGRRSIELRA